jgi:hypothetical protein
MGQMKWFAVMCLLLVTVGAAVAATTPTYYDFSSAEKQQILEVLNTSSTATLTSIGLSSAAIKAIGLARPYSSWDVMWATSVGGNTNAKKIAIHLGLITEIQDRYASKACLRTRPSDRSRIVGYLNSTSSSRMLSDGISATSVPTIIAGRPYDWKKALRDVSTTNLKKAAILVGAFRYVSGSTPIESISGIGASYGSRFRALKFFTSQTFLMHAVWPSWRAEIAGKVNLAEGFITRWAKRADLNRISGIGEQYGDLLAYAGVETMQDLASKDPVALRTKMIAMNTQYNLVNTLPSQTTVTGWVNKAKTLPKMLEF